eukprot:875534-Prymnesium_polylepis.1
MPAMRPCPPAVLNATATRADTALAAAVLRLRCAAHSNALRNASSTQLACASGARSRERGARRAG